MLSKQPLFYDVGLQTYFDSNAKIIHKPSSFQALVVLLPTQHFFIAHVDVNQNDDEAFAHALLQLNLDGYNEYCFIRPARDIVYLYTKSFMETLLNSRGFSNRLTRFYAIPYVVAVSSLVRDSRVVMIVWTAEHENFICCCDNGVIRFLHVLEKDSIALVLPNITPVLNFNQLVPQAVLCNRDDECVKNFALTLGISCEIIQHSLYSNSTMEFIHNNLSLSLAPHTVYYFRYVPKLLFMCLLISVTLLSMPLWEVYHAYEHYRDVPSNSIELTPHEIDRQYLYAMIENLDFPIDEISQELWTKIYEIINVANLHPSSPLLFDVTRIILSPHNVVSRVSLDHQQKILEIEMRTQSYEEVALIIERIKQIQHKLAFINQTQNTGGIYEISLGVML